MTEIPKAPTGASKNRGLQETVVFYPQYCMYEGCACQFQTIAPLRHAACPTCGNTKTINCFREVAHEENPHPRNPAPILRQAPQARRDSHQEG